MRTLQSASYFANVKGPEHTNVEVTDEFRAWWDGLDIRDQRAVAKVVDALVRRGPRLQFPYSSGIKGSRHLREIEQERQRTITRGGPER